MVPQAFFITGVTGNQGGAVAKSLLKRGCNVKGLTRNPESIKAKQQQAAGVEIVKGDLADINTYQHHLHNCDGIFSVQAMEKTAKGEAAKGIALADLAKKYNIKHLVYTSVTTADETTNIPHWKSKKMVEVHIQQLGIPFTIIRPAGLYDVFNYPQVKKGIMKGKLVHPANGDSVHQLIAAKDVGEIAATIFLNREKYLGKTIPLAAEEMSMKQAAEIFSEVMGKQVHFKKLPGFLTNIFMGKNLYRMFQWIDRHNLVYIPDLQLLKNEFPGMISLKEWIRSHFSMTDQQTIPAS